MKLVYFILATVRGRIVKSHFEEEREREGGGGGGNKGEMEHREEYHAANS